MTKRQIRSWALAGVFSVSTVMLSACASNQTREDLEYSRGLLASGRLKEAYSTLQQAQARSPEDPQVRATLVVVRDRLGNFLLSEGMQAAKQQHWEAAEQSYQQAAALPGFETRAQAAITDLQKAKQAPSTAQTGVPLSPSNVTSAPIAPTAPSAAPAATTASPAPKNVPSPAPTAAARGATKPPAAGAATTPAAAATATAPAPQPNSATDLKEVGPGFMKDALQKRLTLQFRDAPVRSLFDILAKTSGLNVVIDKDVAPDLKTSIFLRNTTVEEALKKILLTTQLAYSVMDDNTIIVYPDDVTKQADYQPLVVRSFHMSNADVKLVANSLKTVLKFKDMVVDEKLSMIVVRDTPEAIRQAEQLIAMHDVPEPEVMLEVEILEVSRSLIQNLGIEWPSTLELRPLPSATGGTLTLRDLTSLGEGSIGVAIDPLRVRARKDDRDVNVLANPRLRAKNREKARIHIGERVPNITTTLNNTGFAAESINYIDVGLKLEIEPQVFADNEVVIKIGMEVSNIVEQIATPNGTIAFRIGARNANTVLRLRDGENQVLAGLIQDEDRRTAIKVPLLGDIPILGRLFGTQGDENRKTELVLSITPRLIRGINRPAQDAAGFDAGTATSVRGRRPNEPSSSSEGNFSLESSREGRDGSEDPAPRRRESGRDED